MPLVIPQATAKALIDALKATGQWLDALTLHLFVAPTTLRAGLVLTDLVEPTFPGYAPVALSAWGADWLDSAGNAGITAPSIQFTCTGAADDSIKGYYLTAGTGGSLALRHAELFPGGPIGIARAGDGLIVLPSFTLPELATCTAVPL